MKKNRNFWDDTANRTASWDKVLNGHCRRWGLLSAQNEHLMNFWPSFNLRSLSFTLRKGPFNTTIDIKCNSRRSNGVLHLRPLRHYGKLSTKLSHCSTRIPKINGESSTSFSVHCSLVFFPLVPREPQFCCTADAPVCQRCRPVRADTFTGFVRREYSGPARSCGKWA